MLHIKTIVATGFIMALAAVSYDRIQGPAENGQHLSATQSDSPGPISADVNERFLLAEADCNPRVRVCEK